MSYKAIMKQVSELPHSYYDELSNYLENLLEKARGDTKNTLKESISKTKYKEDTTVYKANLKEHSLDLSESLMSVSYPNDYIKLLEKEADKAEALVACGKKKSFDSVDALFESLCHD